MEPYVFISYAHANGNEVLPCIEAMKRSGINLWYDDGIAAGSEWPEFIAEKVVSCTKFVLFISNAYLNSQNCKREMNFAISRKKDILSIFLEDVILSPGVEMQLGTYQAIYKKRFQSAAVFHDSVCREPYFNPCRRYGTGSSGSQASQAVPNANRYSANSYRAPTTQAAAGRPQKSRIVAALLAIFLGSFGIHKFYLRQVKWGVVYLLFYWTSIPTIVGFVEGVMMLFTSNEKFEQKYNCTVR